MAGRWAFLPLEEVGETLDARPEATGKAAAAESPTAASWNYGAGLTKEQYFSKVTQTTFLLDPHQTRL